MFRAFRKRRELAVVSDRTAAITVDTILAFSTVRNEAVRLPHFLRYYRDLGVGHFLFVDNGSDDGSADYLASQPDVSLWTTPHSYRFSRFGVDWLGWLQMRYGHGHWCLTLDADELLVYPFCDTQGLRDLTQTLERHNRVSFGAVMLDLYPKGPLRDQPYVAGDDPLAVLTWFDAANYWTQWHRVFGHLWIQGGVRARAFFADEPRLAPTLNKVPLVKWNRRFAYVSSTHHLLPPRLNAVFGSADTKLMSGILLHTKFLNIIGAKSEEELVRRQHFQHSEKFVTYHAALAANPDLWREQSCRYTGWRQLVDLGLMSQGETHDE